VTLLVLTLTFSIGFVDRQMINLLVQPIKASFALSDLQISLLQGVGFSLTYLVMSPLFGRWIDLHSRRATIIICVFVWSVSTILCGFAVGFASLFLARALVGAAEAGLTPAAWSMMSDRFSGPRLGRAMSIYNIGPYLGGGLALVIGGIVLKRAEHWDLSSVPLLWRLLPWQLTFLLVGALGLTCMLLLPLVPEPVRQRDADGGSPPAIPLATALAIMVEHKRFYFLFYIGMALAIIPIYAFPAWLPALSMRQFHTPIATVGLRYGIISLCTGTAGVLISPAVAALLGRRGTGDANMRLGVLTSIMVCACGIALFFRPSFEAVLWTGGIASFFYSMPTAMAATALQTVTPARMRGLVTAIYIVAVTIMGLAIAPTLVAFVTDRIFHDEMRVGDSLAIVCTGAALLSGLSLWGSLSGYRRLLRTPIDLRSEARAAVP
jgi:MFS family permease